MEAQLQSIYDEQGRPGSMALRIAARRKGLQISEAEARAFVSKQSTGQVFRARIPSDGKIMGGSREDMRFQMDIIDFSKKISRLTGNKYVLVAVDNYNRQAFTQPMKSKSADATLTAFRRIVSQNGGVVPKEITVDNDGAFASVETEVANKGGVLRRKNMQSVNTLAAVDRVIQSLKTILSSYSLTGNWAENLKKATRVYNDRGHEYLMQSAPDDVKGSEVLQYELTKRHGLQIKHNFEKWKSKAGKLSDEGAFRIPLPRREWDRVDAPKFSGQVYEVGGFKGANVETKDGQSFPVKTALAVPRGSRNVDLADSGPGQGKRALQRQMLQDYAKDLKGFLKPEGVSLAAVTRFLSARPNFLETAEAYGVPRAGRFVNFLKLYSNLFRIEGSGSGIKVFPATSPEPRVEEPSGSRDVPSFRMPVVDRQPFRFIPNNQIVDFAAENPARPGTERHRRYERYSSASSMGEARRLGMLPMDVRADLRAGALRLR